MVWNVNLGNPSREIKSFLVTSGSFTRMHRPRSVLILDKHLVESFGVNRLAILGKVLLRVGRQRVFLCGLPKQCVSHKPHNRIYLKLLPLLFFFDAQVRIQTSFDRHDSMIQEKSYVLSCIFIEDKRWRWVLLSYWRSWWFKIIIICSKNDKKVFEGSKTIVGSKTT